MISKIKLYSNKDKEIFNFISSFFSSGDTKLYKSNNSFDVYLHSLEWEKEYNNPVEIATILGVFIDNYDKYNITMWICLDKGYYINITENNADKVIRYLYERYPN